jgi:hypothetical protein
LMPILFEALDQGRQLGFTLSEERIVLLCHPSAKSRIYHYQCVEELWGSEGKVEAFENGDEHETAFLCYSSGTVGTLLG